MTTDVDEVDGTPAQQTPSQNGAAGRAEVVPPPRWSAVAAFVLSLAGLGVSIYLTIDHFAKIPPVCVANSVFNCEKVTTSAQSYFLGIPVAMLGLGFYVVMTAINLPMLQKASDRRIHVARLVLAGVGMIFVLYLISAELLIIGNICIWCTSVHVITFLIFALTVTTVPKMLGWGTDQGGPI